MRLARQDLFRLGFRDAGWQGFVGGGDVLGDVLEHVFSALYVFIKQIRGKLGIENARGTNGEDHQEEQGNDSDEKIGDDEAVAQAPKQTVPSPSKQPVEQIDA